VVNGARSALRRRRTARAHLEVVEPVPAPAADADLLVAEEHRQILLAIRDLPDRQREVLLLRYWSDLSEADIAATLGISAGAVKSSASRGLDNLSKMLGGSR
jgi:RNA polymerase sigma factor (sigma-70 family)